MNVLSLFDGISCGMLALEKAGIKIDNYFASEIEPNALSVSKYNYPNIIQLGDVTNWKEWNLPKIDLLIGGSPCQGFTRAGKCLNFEDPRSKLFFEFYEILVHLREKNPNVLFMLENVKMKLEWQDVISEFLGVQPIEINSRLVSAQNRRRLYWTNIKGVEKPKEIHAPLIDIIEKDADVPLIKEKGIWFQESYLETQKALVNLVDGELRVKQPTIQGYIVAKDGDGINLSYSTSTTRRGRVIDQKSTCLDRGGQGGVYYDGIVREFTLTEIEALQTLPKGYVTNLNLPPSVVKQTIGNAWTVDVIVHILSYLEEGKEEQFEQLNLF